MRVTLGCAKQTSDRFLTRILPYSVESFLLLFLSPVNIKSSNLALWLLKTTANVNLMLLT